MPFEAKSILTGAVFLAGVAGLGINAPAQEPEQETVAADTFIALCDEAKSSVELTEVEALLGQAEGQRGVATAQLEKAEADLATAFDGLTETGLSEVLKLDKAIEDKLAATVALTAEIEALSASLKGQSGDALNSGMLTYRGKIAERDAIAEETRALQATRGRLNQIIVEAKADTNTDILQAAGSVIEVATGLGVGASLAFAGPIASWTAAKVFLAGAGATDEAATAAIDCIGTRVATLRDAEAAEAKYIRNQTIVLGKTMQEQWAAIERKKEEVTKAWETDFNLSGGDSSRIESLTLEYVEMLDAYVATGDELVAQVGRLQADGQAVEPWMQQLLDHAAAAKTALAEARKN